MDYVFSMVVRARDEEEARKIANEKAEDGPIWNDPNMVSCVNLDDMPKGFVIKHSNGF